MSNILYPLYNSQFGENEIKIIREVFKSKILTHGQYVEEFEKEFANYVDCQFAVAVNSCTSALFLCLAYKKKFNYIKSVYIPSATFVSVANVIKHNNLKLFFNDKVRVGSAYELKDDGNGNKIIDAAHQLERNIYNKFSSSLMCFSFYPIKQLGGAEGGIIATNDGVAYNWLKQARNNGMTRKDMFDWNYDVEFAGWKMNMTNLQAGILLSKLENLDQNNLARKLIRNYYNEQFNLANTSLHLYPIFVKNRNKFINQMKNLGIQTSMHFKPITWHSAYQNDFDILYQASHWQFTLPYTNWWGQHEVSIPFHENLTYQDTKFIVEQIKKYATFTTYS